MDLIFNINMSYQWNCSAEPFFEIHSDLIIFSKDKICNMVILTNGKQRETKSLSVNVSTNDNVHINS